MLRNHRVHPDYLDGPHFQSLKAPSSQGLQVAQNTRTVNILIDATEKSMVHSHGVATDSGAIGGATA